VTLLRATLLPSTLRLLTQQYQDRLRSGSARRLLSTFGAGVVARLGHLGLAIVLARTLGATDYGTFTFAMGCATLAANFGTLGWPKLANRLLPGMIRDQNWGLLKGFRDLSDVVVLAALLTAAALMIAGSTIASNLGQGLIFGAILTVPLGFTMLRRQHLSAVKRPAIGLLFDGGFAALALCLVLTLLDIADLWFAVVAFAALTTTGVIVTTVIYRRLLPEQLADARRQTELKHWFIVALPMVFGTVSKALMAKMDVLMLAPLTDLQEVGLYGAAYRLTYVMSFPQVVLMLVITPILSEALTHNRPTKARKIMHFASGYAFVTTAPALVAFLVAPEWIMFTVFGVGFEKAAKTLAILALAQGAAAYVNAYSALLLMAGRERVFGVANVIALLGNAVLNFILIPKFGGVGAAVATLVTSSALLVTQIALARGAIDRARLPHDRD